MREAERQREAALTYAKSVQGEQRSLKDRLSKLDTGYVKEMEDRITSSLTAAESKLKNAREAADISAEVVAQKEIAKLGYEEARLAEMKVTQKQQEEQRKTLSEGTVPQVPQYLKHLFNLRRISEQPNGLKRIVGLVKIMP